MAVALSIKNVPDKLASALQARAARNHRSLQGELMHILEEAVRDRDKPFRARDLVKRLQKFTIPETANESTRWIRADRDRR